MVSVFDVVGLLELGRWGICVVGVVFGWVHSSFPPLVAFGLSTIKFLFQPIAEPPRQVEDRILADQTHYVPSPIQYRRTTFAAFEMLFHPGRQVAGDLFVEVIRDLAPDLFATESPCLCLACAHSLCTHVPLDIRALPFGATSSLTQHKKPASCHPRRTRITPSKVSTVASGLTPNSSSGRLHRFTQHVQNPKLLAPAMSQKFDDTKGTALSGTPRCCETRPYTRGLDL